MSTQGGDGEPLSVDIRKVRDMSNCIGQSFDIEALRTLGLVDENGELVDEEINAKQTIRDDGTVEIELPTD